MQSDIKKIKNKNHRVVRLCNKICFAGVFVSIEGCIDAQCMSSLRTEHRMHEGYGGFEKLFQSCSDCMET